LEIRKKIMNIDLRQGDCLEVLKTIPDNSVDSVVTDPPYHLTSTKGDKKGFMGKDWDGGDIAFRTDVWSECLRVLKPGGHLLSFSHSRTYHRMAVAIEDAGFEIRDSIMWIYGSGFPKSHNIGKAIDKIEGNEREVGKSKGTFVSSGGQLNGKNTRTERFESKGQSDYEGWGTALKPAHEPICMARKPLSEKSIAENVLKWGTGGINIDGCRIAANWEDERPPSWFNSGKSKSGEPTYGGNLKTLTTSTVGERLNDGGRFPANIILDEEAGKLLDEQSGYGKGQKNPKVQKGSKRYGENQFVNGGMMIKDGWVSSTYDDAGGASRFFYSPKTSKKERGEDNNHPTVKPLKLMEYLIKLVTPKGGVVMDCFMGSGSTGVAARNLGFKFIGIEREQEYMDIAKQRITQSVQTKLDL
jgi:site-specific DNA-methyltransferase (adenine-specific)